MLQGLRSRFSCTHIRIRSYKYRSLVLNVNTAQLQQAEAHPEAFLPRLGLSINGTLRRTRRKSSPHWASKQSLLSRLHLLQPGDTFWLPPSSTLRVRTPGEGTHMAQVTPSTVAGSLQTLSSFSFLHWVDPHIAPSSPWNPPQLILLYRRHLLGMPQPPPGRSRGACKVFSLAAFRK